MNEKNPSESVFPVTEPSTLLPFIKVKLAALPGGKVKSMLEHGQIAVDGRATTRYNTPLRPGQEVSVSAYKSVPPSKAAAAELPEILYEDKEILVINKPEGLLTIATDTEKQHTAYHLFTGYVKRKNKENRLFIVHRLDRDTSGVVLFAKTPELKEAFQLRWDELAKERAYLAVVEGRMENPSGRLTSWLRETKTHLVYSGREPGDGKLAITNYTCLRGNGDYSFLRVTLETGRKNQIRVQMKECGHPVTGDKKYGASRDPLKRLALHACTLQVEHPLTGKLLTFEARPEKAFENFLK